MGLQLVYTKKLEVWSAESLGLITEGKIDKSISETCSPAGLEGFLMYHPHF